MENGRGELFLSKEIIPKKALTFVANTVYNENYETMPMSHKWIENQHSRLVEYNWIKSGEKNTFQVRASKEKFEIKAGSETEFITEHYWGYAKINEEKTNEYEVTHPKWKAYLVEDYKIKVDFGSVYGRKFGFLNSAKPDSVMLAEGSEITVENKKTIKNKLPLLAENLNR